MFKQIAEKLLARLKISWELMVGKGQVCLVLMLQIFLWIPVVSSALTGTLLIVYGTLWILYGISPLLIENRTASVSISAKIIIVSGCSIIGLGIAMMLPLMTEVDWVPRMAGIFYSLAFFIWLFVILKTAPIITQGLLIGVVLCVMATGYALVCNALMVVNAIVADIPRVAVPWDQAVGYIVSGGAVIGWTGFVMRENTPAGYKMLVPVFLLFGVIYIGFGIVLTTTLISR